MEKMDISPSHSKKKKPRKKSKSNLKKQTKKSQLLKETRLEHRPMCNILSQFKISDENIDSFQRYINSPMDCFINALQLMGLLDSLTSNIFRISCVGKQGFEIMQIEKIFILLNKEKHNFDFISTKNFDEFAKTIETNLLPGHVVFAGYSTDKLVGDNWANKTNGHVFIIGRYHDGRIVYIDPQIDTICDINTCQHLIRNRGDNYYLLHNSEEKLTNKQMEKLGFIL